MCRREEEIEHMLISDQQSEGSLLPPVGRTCVFKDQWI